MDDPDWPEIVALVVSLLLTAFLSRLGSMATAVSRSTLERLAAEGAPRARLLLALSRARNLVGQMVSFGQVLAIAIGIIALVGLMGPLPTS